MKYAYLIILASVVLIGCVTPQEPLSKQNSPLTQGNVQLALNVGTTDKSEVLDVFGAPNITTRDGAGREVWTYQRAGQASQSSKSSGYWTVVLTGGSETASGFESSSRMMTLIIKFDENDKVLDFNSRTSNF